MDLGNPILKFIWKTKESRMVRAVLKKKIKTRGQNVQISSFITNVLFIKTMFY